MRDVRSRLVSPARERLGSVILVLLMPGTARTFRVLAEIPTLHAGIVDFSCGVLLHPYRELNSLRLIDTLS